MSKTWVELSKNENILAILLCFLCQCQSMAMKGLNARGNSWVLAISLGVNSEMEYASENHTSPVKHRIDKKAE